MHRVLMLLCLLLAASLPARATEVLELLDFHLIDGRGTPVRQVQRLVSHDGVIVQIDDTGHAPQTGPGTRSTRIALDGAWVMPGLIDTHVHVARFPDTRARAAAILRSAVRGGITGVRDLGGDARALADLERAIASGELVAPALAFSAMFGGPDVFRQGPTAQMAKDRAPGEVPWARRIDPGSDVRQLVAEAKGSGSTNVKLYGDLTAAQAQAIIAEASRQGLTTTAHATVFPARPSDLVEAGIGSLSHAAYLVWEAVEIVPDDYSQRIAAPWKRIAPDHPALLALYRRMAERGTTLDATLYVYRAMQDYPGMPKMDWTVDAATWGEQATRHAAVAGVRVTAGTDWFEPRDDADLPHTHAELALLVEKAGFTPMQAIVAGTRHGAVALGREATQGTVELGKSTDLLVLDADPTIDIRNTTRIRFTVRRGRVVDP